MRIFTYKLHCSTYLHLSTMPPNTKTLNISTESGHHSSGPEHLPNTSPPLPNTSRTPQRAPNRSGHLAGAAHLPGTPRTSPEHVPNISLSLNNATIQSSCLSANGAPAGGQAGAISSTSPVVEFSCEAAQFCGETCIEMSCRAALASDPCEAQQAGWPGPK